MRHATHDAPDETTPKEPAPDPELVALEAYRDKMLGDLRQSQQALEAQIATLKEKQAGLKEQEAAVQAGFEREKKEKEARDKKAKAEAKGD